MATRTAVKEIDPISLAFLRYLQGAIVLFAIMLVSGASRTRMQRSDLPFVALLGLLMFAAFPVLFNSALQRTTASRGAVILATMPLWTALLARRYSGERLRLAQLLGVLISVAGVATIFTESGLKSGNEGEAITGNLLMIGAAFIGGLYAVLAKPVMSRIPAAMVTAWAMLAGAVALTAPALAEGLVADLADARVRTLLLVLYLGIPAGAVAFWLFGYSLARLQPTQALVYVNLNPVVATLLASLLLDESLTVWFALGFVMVVAGLLLTNVPSRSRRPGQSSLTTSLPKTT